MKPPVIKRHHDEDVSYYRRFCAGENVGYFLDSVRRCYIGIAISILTAKRIPGAIIRSLVSDGGFCRFWRRHIVMGTAGKFIYIVVSIKGFCRIGIARNQTGAVRL